LCERERERTSEGGGGRERERDRGVGVRESEMQKFFAQKKSVSPLALAFLLGLTRVHYEKQVWLFLALNRVNPRLCERERERASEPEGGEREIGGGERGRARD